MKLPLSVSRIVIKKAAFESQNSLLRVISTEMAAEGSSVCGGVLLLHTEHEGKHSYEVKDFLSCNKGFFARKGDKLLMINNVEMEHLTPEEFADILIEGSPLLTIHHPSETKTEECDSEKNHAYKKEGTVMRFSLTMVREEDLESTGHQGPQFPDPDWENDDIEDDSIIDDNFLLVSMTDTSFSVVMGRGSDSENPCQNCGSMDCQLHEVVVMPKKANIAYSCAQILKLLKERNNLFLKSHFQGKYVYPSNDQIYLKKEMEEKITIYYYKLSKIEVFSGIPVLLNFTGTDNFFSCTSKGEKKILTIKSCDKKKLNSISADDQENLSLVFYMSSNISGDRCFESALHRGWFIHTVHSNNLVQMHRTTHPDSVPLNNFFIIIESETTKIIHYPQM